LEALEERRVPTVQLLQSITGLNYLDTSCGCTPPDSMMAVGPSSVINAVNTAMRIQSKTGAVIAPATEFSTFFAPVVTAGDGFSDPQVMYDDLAGRFYVCVLELNAAGNSDLDFAVSTTSSPSDFSSASWTDFTKITAVEEGGADFADFPKMGWNADAVFVSLNQFPNAGGPVHDTMQSRSPVPSTMQSTLLVHDLIVSMSKAAILAGAPLVQNVNYFLTDVTTDMGQGDGDHRILIPARMHGTQPGNLEYFVQRDQDLTWESESTVNVVTMQNYLGGGPTFATSTFSVNPYQDSPGTYSTPQIDDRMLSADWINNNLVAAQDVGTVGGGDNLARWYEFNTAGSITLTQQGDIDMGPGIDTSYPSIAMAPNGNIGMTFIGSSQDGSLEPSVYVTGRGATDAPGTMEAPVLVQQGVPNAPGGERSGDYSATEYDPVDGTFWAANEYNVDSGSTDDWGTQIAQFQIDTVFNVNTLADLSIAGGVDPTTGQIIGQGNTVTLRSAIQAANSTPGPKTINLQVPGLYQIGLPGTAGETDNQAGEFAILPNTGQLTIQNGSGSTIVVDGNHLARVFDIDPAGTADSGFSMSLEGFVIQDGSAQPGSQAAGDGGGIRVQGDASLTLTNMVLEHNAAAAKGGGIAMESAPGNPWTLTFMNTDLLNNQAGAAGGGLETNGPGTISIPPGMIISGNTSADGGGGIWINAGSVGPLFQSATLTMTGALVSGNSTTAPGSIGGGIGASGAGAITIIDSTIKHNQAAGAGGGYGDVDFTGTLTLLDSPFLGNTATGDGGAIDTRGGSTTISDAEIQANTSGSNGGGILAGGQSLTILGGTIANNTAGGNGGGIDTGCVSTAISGAEIQANTSGGSGGGILAGGQSLTIQSATIANNNASGNGGGIEVDTSAGSTVTITASIINQNKSNGAGGGIGELNDLGALVVQTSLFSNNSAGGNGGAIQEGSPATTIMDSEFKGNTSGGSGGAVFDSGSALTVMCSTIANNTAGNGGGIEIETITAGVAGAQIVDSSIVANSAMNSGANNEGGAIDAPANFSGSLLLVNDTINANLAASGGGVFWAGAIGSAFRVQNTIIAQNNANTGSDASNPTGMFADQGGNLIGISGAGSGNTGFTAASTQVGTTAHPLDAQLGPLQNNGGPTTTFVLETEALLPGSSAINRGVAGATAVDERGFARSNPPDVGAFEILSPAWNFVSVVYGQLLNRSTDPSAAAWVNLLNAGASPGSVVSGIEGSTEYLTDVVTGLYQRYLHRAPDPGGAQSWVSVLLGGATIEQVTADIVGSAEYFALHGSSNQSFVDALYQDMLTRTADSGGEAYWINALNGGASRDAVAQDFLTSTEYRADLINADYLQFLGRPAEAAGLADWMAALSSGMTDQTLLSAIFGSSEGFNRWS